MKNREEIRLIIGLMSIGLGIIFSSLSIILFHNDVLLIISMMIFFIGIFIVFALQKLPIDTNVKHEVEN